MKEKFKIVKTDKLSLQVKIQLLDLWNNEYPENLSYDNITEFESYLNSLNNLKHFLSINNTDNVLGWAFTFDREDEKWFAIIISEQIKGKGYGKRLLNELKSDESILNGWVIDHDNDNKANGEPYISPLGFYKKSGFEILSAIKLELNKISAVKIRWVK